MGPMRVRSHSLEQSSQKQLDVDVMLNSGHDTATVSQHLEVSESTLDRCGKQYSGTQSKKAVRLAKGTGSS